MKNIEKYSLGMGDRFAHQGRAQLRAVQQAKRQGVEIVPVWNKSNREHTIIGSEPAQVLEEARAAVRALGWDGAYHIDADHINLSNVGRFAEASDFFTIDVADYSGKPAGAAEIGGFLRRQSRYFGRLEVPGLAEPLVLREETARRAAEKFLWAMQEAGRIYRHIREIRGGGDFITEVSVDETDAPQSPGELFCILAMLAQEEVPVQTIAPKFSGRFNKGVDYAGDVAQFRKEFEADLCVVAFAAAEFGLPATLKLSVHSGSDKFSLYPAIREMLARHGSGLHVKTAGTTWLEEVIGLAEAGEGGLEIAKEIYVRAAGRFEELVKPYAPVVDIHPEKLPGIGEVRSWRPQDFVDALRHEASCPAYNPDFRQFLHVSFKIAAEMGAAYTDALKAHEGVISRNVTDNLFRRHILNLFPGFEAGS